MFRLGRKRGRHKSQMKEGLKGLPFSCAILPLSAFSSSFTKACKAISGSFVGRLKHGVLIFPGEDYPSQEANSPCLAEVSIDLAFANSDIIVSRRRQEKIRVKNLCCLWLNSNSINEAICLVNLYPTFSPQSAFRVAIEAVQHYRAGGNRDMSVQLLPVLNSSV